MVVFNILLYHFNKVVSNYDKNTVLQPVEPYGIVITVTEVYEFGESEKDVCKRVKEIYRGEKYKVWITLSTKISK